MSAFLLRMPAGIPGQVTRLEQSTIEPQVFDPAVPFPAYGVPMKTGSNGKMQPIAAGDTAALVEGLLVRPYPTTGSPTSGYSATIGGAIPPTTGVCNRLVRGYMMVLLSGTAAAIKDGPVYMRVGGPVTGKPIGGFEAVVDSVTAGNTVLIPNARFTGPADAQGNTEIAYNI